MKPLNLDNKPCSPISSNCVIWQGPDIECINICNGDSVSDVVAALATELCNLLTETNVSSYDLTCLGVTSACPPPTFQALIQLLIDKICELNNVPSDTPVDSSGCPDCIVSVASCFVEGTTTNMQLIDYVQAIASKVCALVDNIADLQTQIDGIDIRVTALENATPPSFTIPPIATGCLSTVIPGTPATEAIDIVLDYLVNDSTIGYCSTINALFGSGSAADILAVVNPACIQGSSASITSGNDAALGTMSGDYAAWINTPLSLADTLNNLWIAICDLRNITTVAFTDTGTVSFVENSGLPNYNFSANINQPRALIKAVGSGVGGVLDGGDINKFNGLKYSGDGYVVNVSNTSPNTAFALCNGTQWKFPGGTIPYDTFSGGIASGGQFQPPAGVYNIGFKVSLSAPTTTTPLPDAPSEGTPFGTGKGWYGGDNVSSNDQPRAIILASGGTAPGAGYTDGVFTVVYPNGTITIQITTVGGGNTSIASITLLNATGSFDSSDLITVPIAQPGSDSSAIMRIVALTKPTPKVTVLANVQNIASPTNCTSYCDAVFAPNNSVVRCDLSATQLGVVFNGTERLEVKLAILVNDEDPLVSTNPNPRWEYKDSYLSSTDSFEFFIQKIAD